jgi:hypothetical protein
MAGAVLVVVGAISTVRLLFDVSLDDWALDEASSWLEELTIEIAPPTTGNRRYRLSFSLTDDQLMDLTEPASKLCQRLIACGDCVGAERAIKVAREGLRKAQVRGLVYEPLVNAAREVMEGDRKPRFVLNHPRQLDNAFRLGAIDEKRYAANLARINKRQADRELDRIERTELLSSSRFIERLPIDHSLSRKAAPGRLIPHPGWYEDRAETLTSGQQAEYLAAFGPDSTLEAVEKYAWVRLSSLIRSATYHLERVEVSALAAEAELLGKLQPRCAFYANGIEELLSRLAKLGRAQAREVVEGWQLLLNPEPPFEVGPIQIIMETTPAESTPSFFEDAAAVLLTAER